MEVEVRNIEGVTFIGKGESNHWVSLDGPEKFGGSEAGSKPMELVLISLGGCTGMDITSLLNKMRVNYDDFKIKLSAERSEEQPKIFTKIHIKYIFKGKDIPEDKIEKAVNLSQEKYCSVSAMLREAAEVTYEYEIREE